MTFVALTASIILALAAFLFFSGYLTTYRRYRGRRVITCPENLESAAVRVNAMKAAQWEAISGDTVLRLNQCSRWPEKAGCDQACLSQIQADPQACAVQTIVSDWYTGKRCAYCASEIGEIVWHERPPAVRSVVGEIREWNEIPAEQLPIVFATHAPVCFNCSLTERLLKEHPDLVVSRVYPAQHEPMLTPSINTY